MTVRFLLEVPDSRVPYSSSFYDHDEPNTIYGFPLLSPTVLSFEFCLLEVYLLFLLLLGTCLYSSAHDCCFQFRIFDLRLLSECQSFHFESCKATSSNFSGGPSDQDEDEDDDAATNA